MQVCPKCSSQTPLLLDNGQSEVCLDCMNQERKREKMEQWALQLDAHCNVVAKRSGDRILLELRVSDAVALVGQIILASKHPQNTGLSARIARAIVDRIVAGMDSLSPGIGKMISQHAAEAIES